MPPKSEKSLSSASSGKTKSKQKAVVKEEVKKVVEKKEPVPKKIVGPSKGFAIVKAVLSADTIVLMGAANAESSAPEKQIVISNIQAPKLARSRNQVDEPFAWEAREFLRKKLVGQQVQFQVTYTHPESGREYANVFWNDENVAHLLVKNGYATVKGASEKKEGRLPAEKEELFQLQEEAEVMGLGIHQRGLLPKETTRQIDWSPNAQEIFDQFKNIPLPAVIDSVRDGSTLRCEVVGLDARNPLSHTMITVHLSGVQAPRTPLPLSVLQQQYDAKYSENPESVSDRPTADSQQVEPYALEAQQFTESRLLHRDVQLTIQGIDKSGNLFGSVSYVKGNISLRLLELGLAKFVPWSAALTAEAPLLREAEANAKQSQIRLWKTWSEGDAVLNSPEELPAELHAKVIQVLSGDTVVVADVKNVERKVSLASVRAPRLGRARNGAGDEPCAAEAKEFLRRNLIGKKVRVVFEYSRPAPVDAADKSLRHNVSIFVGEQNITLQLVAAGLASVIRHRMDEERSQFYEDYMQAETKAQREEKGIHAKKVKAPQRIIDLTERFAPRKSGKDDAKESKDEVKQRQVSAKAKTFLPFLQRGEVDAVVEHVFGGARLKLYVPKDNVMISFAIAGIRCAGPKDKEGKPDVFGEQALAFTRSKCLQHNVKIEVESLDKADNFIGNLFLGSHQNLAVLLLQEGLATLFQYSADRNPHRAQLIEAERQAKEARRGIWQNYVEPTPEEKKMAEDAEGAALDTEVSVNITEILDGATFYAHIYPTSSSSPLIRTIEAKMQEFTDSSPEPQEFKVENRTVCAGLFTDDKYYRVRIEQIMKKTGSEEKEYRVFFIDYGNYDILELQHLRPLPAELAKLPPQATLCVLAGLRAPSNEDYKEVATQTFTDLAFGRPLTGRIEFQDYNGFHHIVLTDPSAEKSEEQEQTPSINTIMLRQGLIRINPKLPKKLKSFVEQNFKADEEEARTQRIGIHEYGSYVSDDEN